MSPRRMLRPSRSNFASRAWQFLQRQSGFRRNTPPVPAESRLTPVGGLRTSVLSPPGQGQGDSMSSSTCSGSLEDERVLPRESIGDVVRMAALLTARGSSASTRAASVCGDGGSQGRNEARFPGPVPPSPGGFRRDRHGTRARQGSGTLGPAFPPQDRFRNPKTRPTRFRGALAGLDRGAVPSGMDAPEAVGPCLTG